MPNSLAEEAFRPLDAATRAAWRARLDVPAGVPLIGIVARLDRVKDHATLLRAFAQLAGDGTHLVCIGDGPERARLAALTQQLRLDAWVRFPGTLVAPFNVHQLFDVSVLCSVTEGSPNSVLEAMAAGRPVATTRPAFSCRPATRTRSRAPCARCSPHRPAAPASAPRGARSRMPSTTRPG
jgi:glycosyltransferase involved in cell wall biosynthesis